MSSYDLVLVHAPSVYDFRKLSLLPGPVSDLIPSTPVFEMYPIGFTTIASLLASKGYKVRFLNLAARMLASDKFDAERAIKSINSDVFGVDLHWLPHAHGSIEVAKLIKKHHPGSKVVLGGFSATYYHEEIMREYPFVDAVFRGDSTELPVLAYMEALGKGDFSKVPNVSFRSGGKTVVNEMSNVQKDLSEVGFDYGLMIKMVVRSLDLTGHLPYLDWKRNPMLLVTTVRGCSHNCVTCMGSCSSYKRNFGRTEPAFRSPQKIADDIARIEDYFKGTVFLLGDIQQPGQKYLDALLGLLKESRPRNEIVFEFFSPPSSETVRMIDDSVENFAVQISPDSHDQEVRRRQGRHYSNKSLEDGVSALLGARSKRVDLFFMIGLPGQTSESVQGTVAYSSKLMEKINAGDRLLPFISPLAPFVDPGSAAFESPSDYGYTILARTLDQHRNLLLQPSWKHVLNYETKWLTRDSIVNDTYAAGLGMNDAKEAAGAISAEAAEAVRSRIKLAKEFVSRVEVAMASSSPEKSLAVIRDDLRVLSESTVCDKRELDWGRRSYLWSIPRSAISLLLRR